MYSELDSKDKITKPFVDKVYKDYLNKSGIGDEAIKTYIHVFVISMYFAMNRLEENYKEIFANLDKMARDDFYKYVFNKGNENLQSSTLFCCMIKDIYDKDFTRISTGGYAADILIELAKIMEDESIDAEEELTPLAQKWGINQKKLAYYLTPDKITDDIKRYLDCSKIIPLNSPLNPALLKEAIMDNFTLIEKGLRITLGMDGILKDTKPIHGKWTENALSSQTSKLKVRWSPDLENQQNKNINRSIK